MFKQLVILDFANKKVIFSRVSSTETEKDIEDHITGELGLKLKEVEYMIADNISVEW